MMRFRRGYLALVALVVCGGLLLTFVQQAVLRAQEDPPPVSGPEVFLPVAFGISPPVSDLPADPGVKQDEDPAPNEGIKERPIKVVRGEVVSDPTPDGAVQTDPVPEVLPGPSVSFDGISNDDNFSLFGSRFTPPDTDGDVGPNHYVQMVNSVFRIYNKAGVPLTPPRRISSLFSTIAPPCNTRDDGDPVVLYDPMADRWVLTQFCTTANPFNHQLIAISQTGDPTGSYFVYDYMMPNIKFNDYPKFGVWPDAYYMTDNQFNQAGTTFLGGGVFAFDRAKMLAGDPTASYIYFDTCPSGTGCAIGGMLPADLDGVNPPAPGAPGLFAYFTANEFGDPTDALRVFAFHADFTTPALSTFTERPESPIVVAPFDPRSPTGRRDIEQPPPAGATAAVDSIQDRLMFRLAYRNFGSHESMVVTHTVNVGTGVTLATHQAAVRYYELRRSGGAWGVNEQATFSPDTTNRWMGSAAMDNDGNLAVGYSASSTTVFPGIRYAGRLASDPPGGLFQGETVMVGGSGVQRDTTFNRWGDYSALGVDPADECTFWYTQMYYSAASQATSTVGWLTRIASFSFPSCTPETPAVISGTVTNAVSGLPVAGAIVLASGGYSRITDAAGHYSMNVGPGTYSMSASKFAYLTGAAAGVVATTGTTTVQDFALTPVPVIASGGAAAIVAEDCTPSTGTIEPGEAISVSLPVKNIGALDTTDLIGTLQATGGVTSPSAPQSYGVVVAGGAAVSRTFTFTADSGLTCGATITLTLNLQDGVTPLGSLTFSFTTGALGAPNTATYSSGNIAVPIPDVATVDVPIPVMDSGEITDVNVRIRLNHTFDGDLDISLLAPDGTSVLLSDNRGAGGDNFGTGANDCSGTHTVFDDSAGLTVASGIAPFAGSFRPDQALSRMNGHQVNGTWKLRVTDTAAIDTGTIGCIQLEITRRQRLCCPFTGGTPAVVAAPPATVAAESCGAGNGAPDPDETVSVSFPLNNVGTGVTTDLVATLLPGGGVATPSGPQSYGVMSPVGGPVARTFSFVPQGICGGTITATLHLQDGATDMGNVSFTMTLGTSLATPVAFSNPAAITIPAGAPGTTTGPATPYPSSITVAGVTDPVTKVVVRLGGFIHTFPDDVDVLLVGPGGQKLLLLSDAGGSAALGSPGVNLVFDDAAAGFVPDATAITSGTFKPSNYGTADTFAAPAPAGPYPDPQLLSIFNGVNPNGTWRLFVTDDLSGDVGSFLGGWSLTITTAVPVCCNEPCVLTCPADVSVPNDEGLCGATVTFGATGVSGTCGTLSTSPASGSFFAVGDTTVTTTATRSDSTTTTCDFNVQVNDVEDPTATASVDPTTLWPPNHQMVTVTATVSATDNCSVTCSLASVTSSEPDNAGGNGDGNTTNDVQGVTPGSPPDLSFDLRAERLAGGQGRIYTATYTCSDPGGNSASASPTVFVPHDQGGVEDPISLSVDGVNGEANLHWNNVPGAGHYSLVRGDRANLVEEAAFISLGAVTCLEAATQQTSRVDSEVPAEGQVFFYLVAYHQGISSTYGSPSASKPRVPAAGACP